MPTAAQLRTRLSGERNPNTFTSLKLRSWTQPGPENRRSESTRSSSPSFKVRQHRALHRHSSSSSPEDQPAASCSKVGDAAAAILISVSVSCVDQNTNQAGFQALNFQALNFSFSRICPDKGGKAPDAMRGKENVSNQDYFYNSLSEQQM